MFKTRGKIAEEQAKQEEGYIPSKELMSDDDRKNNNPKIELPWLPVIIMGVLAVLIIVCIIVIAATGGPVTGK